MNDVTRYVRVNQSVEALRTTDGTRVQTRLRLPTADARELFTHRQRMMASAVREERRPGLFVFCAHPEWGHVARLWLEAESTPRAGVLGRHDFADLPLPLDDALSLRHLMFVVRRGVAGVVYDALDLGTSHGMTLEDGEKRRLVQARGLLILRASEFVLFCIPTGQPLPWDPDAREPWAALPPRTLEPRRAPVSPRFGPVAHLEFDARRCAVRAGDLHEGLLIGRDHRCDVVLDESEISRVHAVILRVGDDPYLFDAGSTNGTWRGDAEVRRARLGDGDVLQLGPRLTLAWRLMQ
jgi:hypothetical protein